MVLMSLSSCFLLVCSMETIKSIQIPSSPEPDIFMDVEEEVVEKYINTHTVTQLSSLVHAESSENLLGPSIFQCHPPSPLRPAEKGLGQDSRSWRLFSLSLCLGNGTLWAKQKRKGERCGWA
ncbi:hypothetical protein V8C26DRAFT_213693 [Trichoderma gracile]